MDSPIISKDTILRTYREARKSLDPLAAIEHTAGALFVDPVEVEGVVHQREAWQAVGEGV